jgi:hypothetical protein
MAAPPTTKDNLYFFSGTTHGPNDAADCFFVQINQHRHHRASPNRIYELLTWIDPGPALTKKGVPAKRQPPPHKDETAHFYTAQLYHYGLKPFKTKPAAKKALLSAFGGGKTLQVPERILALQVELRTEWLAAHEKARAVCAEENAVQERALVERRLAVQSKHAEIMSLGCSDDEQGLPAAPEQPKKAKAKGTAGSKKGKGSAAKKVRVGETLLIRLADAFPFLASQARLQRHQW